MQHRNQHVKADGFIGGSDARIIMGNDEAAYCASGGRSEARPSRKTCRAI